MRDTFADRDKLRQNNFGALRLILALFVLFSHSFSAYFGGHAKGEPIYRLTNGQFDLGGFAVNAFFAISGYLITLSWLRSPNMNTFMMKRVLRIYPGFIAASFVSLYIIAPIAGATWATIFSPAEIFHAVERIVLLSAPKMPGSFANAPIDVLNMSLWTIRYEFLCYLLVPLIVVVLHKSGYVRSGITLIYLALLAWHASQGAYLVDTGAREIKIIGSLDIWPRFAAYFVGGMVLAFNADRIPFRHWIALLCAIAIVATAWYGKWLYMAVATGGMYLVYYAAYQRTVRLFHIGEKVDLSYGVYLYAWPVQNLLVMYGRETLNVWMVVLLTLVITTALAAMSWFLIERPFLVKKAKLVKKQAKAEGFPVITPSDGPFAAAPPAATARATSDFASIIMTPSEAQKA